MKSYYREAYFAELKDYCHLSGEGDFMEITEWSNGEGVDLAISSKQGNQHIELTWGEIELFKHIIDEIEK